MGHTRNGYGFYYPLSIYARNKRKRVRTNWLNGFSIGTTTANQWKSGAHILLKKLNSLPFFLSFFLSRLHANKRSPPCVLPTQSIIHKKFPLNQMNFHKFNLIAVRNISVHIQCEQMILSCNLENKSTTFSSPLSTTYSQNVLILFIIINYATFLRFVLKQPSKAIIWMHDCPVNDNFPGNVSRYRFVCISM